MPVPPVGPTADVYRIVDYTHGLIGASKPGCDILKPHYDSGIRYADKNNPQPDDPLWGAGAAGGVKWDGTFYRDMIRYPAGGEHFWSSYFKPGSAPGIKLGYWFNFGSGWSHLASDDPAQILAGASPAIILQCRPCAPTRRCRRNIRRVRSRVRRDAVLRKPHTALPAEHPPGHVTQPTIPVTGNS